LSFIKHRVAGFVTENRANAILILFNAVARVCEVVVVRMHCHCRMHTNFWVFFKLVNLGSFIAVVDSARWRTKRLKTRSRCSSNNIWDVLEHALPILWHSTVWKHAFTCWMNLIHALISHLVCQLQLEVVRRGVFVFSRDNRLLSKTGLPHLAKDVLGLFIMWSEASTFWPWLGWLLDGRLRAYIRVLVIVVSVSLHRVWKVSRQWKFLKESLIEIQNPIGGRSLCLKSPIANLQRKKRSNLHWISFF
jgi:hypothetical protein